MNGAPSVLIPAKTPGWTKLPASNGCRQHARRALDPAAPTGPILLTRVHTDLTSNGVVVSIWRRPVRVFGEVWFSNIDGGYVTRLDWEARTDDQIEVGPDPTGVALTAPDTRRRARWRC